MLEAASHVLSLGVDGDHRDRAARASCRCGRRTGAWIRPTVEELVAANHAALLILENTHTRAGGTTLSAEPTEELAAAAKRHDCRVHIDGARLSTPRSRSGSRSADLAAPANSVVISLNKALSAPFGAVLAGSEAVVERARLMLHRLGGGSVHRAGIAAAAGLVALDTMVDRSPTTIAGRASSARCSRRSPASAFGPRRSRRTSSSPRSAAPASPRRSWSRCSRPRACACSSGTLSRLRFVTHPLIGDAEIEQAAAIVADVVERHAVAPAEEPEVEGLDEYLAWEAEQIAAIEQADRPERAE